MQKESLSAQELSKQTFEGVQLVSPFHDLLGETDLKAIGMIFGENYSGKSTLALGLANAFADYGRVDYVPAEEHFGITVTKKVNQLKAYNSNLQFKLYKGLKDLKQWAKDVKPKVIFIDSVSVLDANDSDVVEFAQWCRENGIGMWMVSHANKDGSYKGNSSLAHETDINIEVLKDGTSHTIKNRILGELRDIPTPFTHKDIGKSRSRKKKQAKPRQFEATMSEVEEMMQAIE